MKVVVTGATGHIGNVLVRDLIDRGYEVTSMVLNEKDGEVIKDLNTKIVYGDVRKIETLVKAFVNTPGFWHVLLDCFSLDPSILDMKMKRNDDKWLENFQSLVPLPPAHQFHFFQ